MQFLLPWMKPRLELWDQREIHPQAPRALVPHANHDLKEATLATEAEGPPEENGAFERLSQKILAYDIFGPKIGQIVCRSDKVSLGETIGLRYRFCPGLSLFFASRVVEVFDHHETEQGWRSGFIYQTLQKHPELGEEIFEVTKLRNGVVKFRLEAWSRPNLWFVKLAAPWARHIQKYAAHCAFEHLARSIEDR